MQIEGYLFLGHGFRLIGIGFTIGIGFDSQNISIANPIAIRIPMVRIHANVTCDFPEAFTLTYHHFTSTIVKMKFVAYTNTYMYSYDAYFLVCAISLNRPLISLDR